MKTRLTLLLAVFFTVHFSSAHAAKGDFFSDIKVNYVNYRIDRAVDAGSSFSIVSNSSYDFAPSIGYYFTKNFSVFLDGNVTLHNFDAPSSRTLQEEAPTTFEYGLGSAYRFKGFSTYLRIDQIPLLVLQDIDSNTHRIEKAGTYTASLGGTLYAKSKSGFRLNLDLRGSMPISEANFENSPVTLNYLLLGTGQIEFGQKFFYGLELSTQVANYTNAETTYTSSQIYAGFFSKFYF